MDENDETRVMGDEGENDLDATVCAPPSVSRTAAAPRRAPEPVRNAVPSPSQTSYYGYGYGDTGGSDGRGSRRGPNLTRITLVLVGALVALIVFAVVSSCVSDAVSSVTSGASSGATSSGTATSAASPEPTSSTSDTETGFDLGEIADTLGDAASTVQEVAKDVGSVARDVASELPSQVKGLLSSR